jgi:hypothetical protein
MTFSDHVLPPYFHEVKEVAFSHVKKENKEKERKKE